MTIFVSRVSSQMVVSSRVVPAACIPNAISKTATFQRSFAAAARNPNLWSTSGVQSGNRRFCSSTLGTTATSTIGNGNASGNTNTNSNTNSMVVSSQNQNCGHKFNLNTASGSSVLSMSSAPAPTWFSTPSSQNLNIIDGDLSRRIRRSNGGVRTFSDGRKDVEDGACEAVQLSVDEFHRMADESLES